MKNCTKCGGELINGLKLSAQGTYPITIQTGFMHKETIQARLCPDCGEVSFFLEKDSVEVLLKELSKKKK